MSEQPPPTETLQSPAQDEVRLERPLLLDSTPRDLMNFYYYQRAFDAEELDRIDQVASRLPVMQGTVGGEIVPDYRTSRVKWIPMTKESAFLYETVAKLVCEANEKLWRFTLACFKEDGQYAEYDSAFQGHYDWHADVGNGAPTRKLSVSLQLSSEDEYDGGDLELRVHRSTIRTCKKKGTLIIFPSYLSHRVTPVTRGIRRSMVFWLHGPPFT